MDNVEEKYDSASSHLVSDYIKHPIFVHIVDAFIRTKKKSQAQLDCDFRIVHMLM